MGVHLFALPTANLYSAITTGIDSASKNQASIFLLKSWLYLLLVD